MKHIEALKMALEALQKCDSALAEELAAWDIDPPLHHVQEASNACGPVIAAIREALAEQPSKPLTDEQRFEAFARAEKKMMIKGHRIWRDAIADEIEAAHGIKGDA